MPDHDWQAHYESGTPPWETGQSSRELARVIAEQAIKPCRVMELGCGSGMNAVWLAQRGFDVTGLDFTPLAIERARERAAAAGVQIRVVLADVLSLDEEFEPFPLFFDRGCYHCVRTENVEAYLRTLRKVTSPGSLGLILSGNAREPSPAGQGPPVVSAEQIRAELTPAFEIVSLREFRFDAANESAAGPLAWSCLVRRSV